jgi:hypothetical protein
MTNSLPKGAPKRPTRRDETEVIELATGLNRQLQRLALPEAFTWLRLEEPDSSQGGRPREFPAAFFSGLAMLRLEYPTVKGLVDNVEGNAVLIKALWDGALKAAEPYSSTADMKRWRRKANEDAFPSRATVQRYFTHASRRPADELTNRNLDVVRELKAFDPKEYSDPLGPGRTLTADGTVYRGPTANADSETVNKDTGEIHQRRIDPASNIYTDGTGTKTWGPKVAIVGTRALPHLQYGVTVGIGHVDDPSPSAEFDKVVELIKDVQGKLNSHGLAATSVTADGAPDGKHVAALADLGVATLSTPKRKKGKIPRRSIIGTFTKKGKNIILELEGPDIYELVNVAGKRERRRATQRLKIIQKTDAAGHLTQYIYQEVTTESGQTILVPHTQMDGRYGRPMESDEQYLKRMSLMRAAAYKDPRWTETYGTDRGTAERANKGDDDAMPDRRIPAWGYHNQLCWVADRKAALALDLLAAHRIASGAMSPPHYPDVTGRIAAQRLLAYIPQDITPVPNPHKSRFQPISASIWAQNPAISGFRDP